MPEEIKAALLLDDFIEDLRDGKTPRLYQRMAEAIGVEVATLLELISMTSVAGHLTQLNSGPSHRQKENARTRIQGQGGAPLSARLSG